MLFIRIGFVRRDDPAPLLTTISIGQPIFMLMKSTTFLVYKLNSTCNCIWISSTYLNTKQILKWMTSQQCPFWTLTLYNRQEIMIKKNVPSLKFNQIIHN
jgi:hypothetical protein